MINNISNWLASIPNEIYFNLFLNIIVTIGAFITAIYSARYTIKKERNIQKNIKQVEYTKSLYEKLERINSLSMPHNSQIQRIIELADQGRNHQIDHITDIGTILISLEEELKMVVYDYRFIKDESVRSDGTHIKKQVNSLILSYKSVLHFRQAGEHYLKSENYSQFEEEAQNLKTLLSESFSSVDQLLSELIEEVYL